MSIKDEIDAVYAAHDQADTDLETALMVQQGATQAARDQAAALTTALAVSDALVVQLQTRIVELEQLLEPDPPPPPQPLRPFLGMYNGTHSEGGDDAARSLFGAYPEVSSTYYQTQRINQTAEQARMGKGISPLITVTTKGTQRLAGIATGDLAWLDQYLEDLNTLALSHPDVPVYATLDHEWEVKVNSGAITGLSASPAVYGKALSTFIIRARVIAPTVKVGYWFGYSDKTKIAAVLASITVPVDWMSLDPYTWRTDPATETPAQCWDPQVSWLRTRPDYTRLGSPPVFLSEFGIDVKAHGDVNGARYFTDLRAALVKSGLAGAVHFNRVDGVNTWKFTTGEYPQSVAAFSASLKSAQ